MSQWEYRKIDLNGLPLKTNEIDVLNDSGEDGWELVALTANNFAYLKRAMSEQSPAKATRRKTAAASET